MDYTTLPCVCDDISKYYNIGKEIGHGKYGIVRLVAKKSFDKKRFALKTIPRDQMHKDVEVLKKEFDVLKTADHPNIIKFYEMYMDDHYFHFVTEFCGGGELFHHIIEKGRFSETQSASIIK